MRLQCGETNQETSSDSVQWNEILRIKYAGVFMSKTESSGAKWKEHTLQPRYPHLSTVFSPGSLVWMKYNSSVVKLYLLRFPFLFSRSQVSARNCLKGKLKDCCYVSAVQLLVRESCHSPRRYGEGIGSGLGMK